MTLSSARGSAAEDAAAKLDNWQNLCRGQRRLVWLLGILLLLTMALASAVGAAPTPFPELFQALFASDGGTNEKLARFTSIWLSLRLPRLLLAAIIGMILAASGVVMQSMFRNPLGDPALLGVSGGAAIGAVAALSLGLHRISDFSFLFMPFLAFCGGLLAAFMVYAMARRLGRADMTVLLLGGVALNSLSAAATGVFIINSSDPELRGFMFWMLGGLDDADWFRLAVVTLFATPALAIILAASKALDAFVLGERNALSLGFAVERERLMLVGAVAIGVGVSVSFCGIIGFVGLLAPHFTRILVGARHAVLLPGALLLGAIIMVLADSLARVAFLPGEAPVGVVTAFLGAPFFMYLLFAGGGQERV